MSAKYLILGALMDSPVHGYELKKNAARKIFGDFGINDGQLYPMLKTLEKEGRVEKKVVAGNGTPNRHVYRITKTGREEFLRWIESDEGEGRSIRYDFIRKDAFFLRCVYLSNLTPEKAAGKIEKQMATVSATLSDFRAAHKSMMEKGIDPLRVKIIEYGIMQEQTRLKWLGGMLSEVSKNKAKRRNKK